MPGAALDVLVVDDDPVIRRSFGDVLRQAGYEVVEAEDGFAALHQLRTNNVGAMVLEVTMPTLDGLHLLDLMDDPPPVVLVSAQDWNDDIAARKGKIFFFAQKPVSPVVLLAAVELAVGRGQYRMPRSTRPRVLDDPELDE